MNMVTVKELDEDLLYPSSDGKPMAENTDQYEWIVRIKENLEVLFGKQDNVFIAADLLWYPIRSSLNRQSPIEDKEKRSLAPDVMVVFGRPKGRRQSYKQWEENNIPPSVVFEILSPSNSDAEMAEKLLFYQQYGVQEYYIYDPESYALEVRVRHQNKLVEITEVDGWISPRLGIKFDTSHGELIIYGPDGEKFITTEERSDAAKIQKQLTQQERQRAQQAEERAERERQRAQQAEQQVQQERQRAEQLSVYLRSLGIDPDNFPKT
jgi:Uma2 family endonuclease